MRFDSTSRRLRTRRRANCSERSPSRSVTADVIIVHPARRPLLYRPYTNCTGASPPVRSLFSLNTRCIRFGRATGRANREARQKVASQHKKVSCCTTCAAGRPRRYSSNGGASTIDGCSGSKSGHACVPTSARCLSSNLVCSFASFAREATKHGFFSCTCLVNYDYSSRQKG